MTNVTDAQKGWERVSTHMPLARHDRCKLHKGDNIDVSTHMPLARHDIVANVELLKCKMFLLTCLLRGMTEDIFGTQIDYESFYSHASCEA